MEYGYEIIDTAGNKTFFVEGCTYCRMGTGGLHEQHCPLSKHRPIEALPDGIFKRTGGTNLIRRYNGS